jgi:hypothetical protein
MSPAPGPLVGSPPGPAPHSPFAVGGAPQLRRRDDQRRLRRLGFVVAALFGVGVVIHLLLWIIMPPPADATPDRLGPVDKVMGDLHLRLTGNRAG